MRKIHFLIMLCLPLCLSIQAKAEPEGMLPAEKAEMKAGKKPENQENPLRGTVHQMA